MGWSSLFRRSVAEPEAQEPVDAVQRARTRARQRLIGAVVLLVIGVLGFPLIFETQPRPVPVDIPIEIPKREGAPPLVMPPVARATDGAAGATDEPVTGAPDRVITETRDEAGRELGAGGGPAASATPAPQRPAAMPGTTKPSARADPKVASRPDTAMQRPDGAVQRPDTRTATAADGDAARARALLEGKPATAAASEPAVPRYIIQVGAYAEPGAAQGARARLEKLGLKTYTQVANTPEGSRIRVRLGPFASREEADRALAKARGAGLGAVLQVL